eukprot:gene6958-9513_t
MQREQQLLEQRKKDKEIEDEYIKKVRHNLALIAATYRKSQSELTKTIIESRIESLEGLTRDCVQSLESGQPVRSITISFPKIFKNNVDKGLIATDKSKKDSILNNIMLSNNNNTIINSSANGNSSKKDGTANYESFDGSLLSPSRDLFSTEESSSMKWHNCIWLALVGKSWDVYKFETYGRYLSASSDEDQLTQKNQQIKVKLNPSDNSNTTNNAIKTNTISNEQELGNTGDAIRSYAIGSLIDQKRLMQCIVLELKKFQENNNIESESNVVDLNNIVIATKSSDQLENTNSIPFTGIDENSKIFHEAKFLKWISDYNPVLGLQAYRLFTEILYRQFISKLSLDRYSLESSLTLRSYRSYPGSQRNGMYKREGNGGLSLKTSINNTSAINTPQDFTWTVSDGRSDALNECVICVALDSNPSPCDLSIQLLSRLREMLKSYCLSPQGSKICKKSSNGTFKLKLVPSMVEDLFTSSAFRAFELQCCQLQKIDIRNMTLNQRLLFFTNIYNTLTVHAIIAKGSPGTQLNLERLAFMKNSKYNIGGMIFNLLDIEHGILRHSSSKPMIFGPLTYSVSFGDRDPRKAYILEEARPNVSFCLFTACVSSPSLVILKNVALVDEEMKKFARRYIQTNVRLDPIQKSVELPGLIKIYWADFGGNRAKVLKMIYNMSEAQFASDLKPYMASIEGTKPKVEFAPVDWTPFMNI